jgi:6-phosphogluconate dehydrogenase (decarboxylating)
VQHFSSATRRTFQPPFTRGDADYQDKLLSAMRYGFGGHLEKTTK